MPLSDVVPVYTLQLGDFLAGSRQLGCRLPRQRDGGQSTLTFELAPLKQQSSQDAFMPSDQ